MQQIGVDEQGDVYQTKVRNVCEKCNNGWMALIHKKARSIIMDLARNNTPTLSDEDHFLLVRWVTMIMFNLECYSAIITSTVRQRKDMFSGLIPQGLRLSMGFLTDVKYAGQHYHRTYGLTDDRFALGYLPMTTSYFCIEQVAFHAVTSLGDKELADGLLMSNSPQKRALLKPLWPKEGCIDLSNTPILIGDVLLDIQELFSGYAPIKDSL